MPDPRRQREQKHNDQPIPAIKAAQEPKRSAGNKQGIDQREHPLSMAQRAIRLQRAPQEVRDTVAPISLLRKRGEVCGTRQFGTIWR